MPNKTEKIAVLGAGTMGAGIAQVAAQAGFETIVYDVKQEFIDVGLGRVQNFLRGSRDRGKLTAEQEQEILDRFRTTTKLEDCKGTSLVIEAAPEKLDLKRDIFKQLAGRITTRSETFRILSEGKVASTGARQRIEAVVQISKDEIQTLSYREDL